MYDLLTDELQFAQPRSHLNLLNPISHAVDGLCHQVCLTCCKSPDHFSCVKMWSNLKLTPKYLGAWGLSMSEWSWTMVKYFGVRKKCSSSMHQVFLSLFLLATLSYDSSPAHGWLTCLSEQLCLPHQISFVPPSDRLNARTWLCGSARTFLTLYFHAFTTLSPHLTLSPNMSVGKDFCYLPFWSNISTVSL